MVERPKLLWFGRPPTPDDIRETVNRGLALEQPDPSTEPDFTHARAAVFWATKPHYESAVSQLEKLLAPAINNGLFLFVVVETPGTLSEVNRVLTEGHPEGALDNSYRVRTSEALSPVHPFEAPQEALMHPVRRAPNKSLSVDAPAGVDLSDAHRLLLQRAFSDCKAVKLELITGGFSGAMTFNVQATLAASNAGPIPMPFFAKLHESSELRKEMQAFQEYAEHHVSWHLRPDFLPDRCLYGVHHGILVGRFADGSRSLWEVAMRGQGPTHIRSLFNETLLVLRSDRQIVEPPSSVIEPLQDFCKYWRVSKERVRTAEQFGGEVYPASTLWRKLLNLPSKPWLRSPIHGDLHASNVRVRKDDSIVIDFAHARRGPMSADLASLEVWLAFEWPAGCAFDADSWRRRVEHAYRPSEVARLSWSTEDPAMNHWVLPCLHELRQLSKIHCVMYQCGWILAEYRIVT